jgi:GNAT superfamily N-acetyltransferase
VEVGQLREGSEAFNLILRSLQESDYKFVISVVDEWWGGRHMADMLPKLFFRHFNDTSFVAQEDGELVGFLIGFISQSHVDEAYIHFVGIHPDYRGKGIGRKLYLAFFEKVERKGCKTVHCVTSPVNKGSINFHTQMGFQIDNRGSNVNGIPVNINYDGHDQDRVIFTRKI